MSSVFKRELLSPSPPMYTAKRPYRPDMDELDDEIDELAPDELDAPFFDDGDDERRPPEPEVNTEGDTFFRIGEKMRVTQRTFNGKVLIDIREYYTKDGQDLPGKKGVALSLDQYRALQQGPTEGLLAEDDDASGMANDDRLEQSAEGERFYRLGESGASRLRRVSLREVKGREVVDIREFYLRDTEEAPGIKGVALQLDEWRSLLQVPVDFPALPPTMMAAAKKQAAGVAGPGPSSAATATAAAATKDSPAEKKRRLSAAVDDGRDELQVGPERFETNAEGERFLRLGNNRRLTVRSFKGKPLVDLREFYTDPAGEERPGTKGLSLSAEQWSLVRTSTHAIDSLLSDLLGSELPSAPAPAATERRKAAPAAKTTSTTGGRGRGGGRGGTGAGRGSGWGRGAKR